MLEENTNESHIEKDKEFDTYHMSSSKVLTKSQKLVATGLAFFSFLTVVFWSYQFKQNIRNPFETSNKEYSDSANEEVTCSDGSCNTPIETSVTKDTDGDGLWDFDEENIYGTSIYLEDTDSDGVSDKDEIDRGTDPNSLGENLDNFEDNIENGSGIDLDDMGVSDENISELLTQIGNLEITADSSNTNVSSEEQLQLLLEGKASAEVLRKMLKDAGMDENVLNNLSNEELLEVYKGMVEK